MVLLPSEALAEFPELQRLIDLKNAGWIFLASSVEGEITELHGIHPWPQGWADALRVRYISDAAAVRCDHTGHITWRHEGTLPEIVDGLISLPTPDDRLAPRLVISGTPRLWRP